MEQSKTELNKDYKEFLGKWITVERANSRIAKGILKEITSDGKLKVVGDYTSWIIDPSTIIEFSAREVQQR